jgi:hypothetical protein
MNRSPAGDDEGDSSPAGADDGRDFVLQGAELQLIIPLARAGVVRLGGDQVAAGDQLVALDEGVVAKWPTYHL